MPRTSRTKRDIMNTSFGDARPKPIPAQPTHCRNPRCGLVLPLLRRYAGLCAECVRLLRHLQIAVSVPHPWKQKPPNRASRERQSR